MMQHFRTLDFAWTYGLTREEAELAVATYYKILYTHRWSRKVTREHVVYYILKFKTVGTPMHECMRQARGRFVPMTIERFHEDVTSRAIYG